MNPKAIETSDYVEGQFAAAKARNDARTVDKMTVREAFSMAAMRGLLVGHAVGDLELSDHTQEAVKAADALIEALNNSQAEGMVEKTNDV